MENSQQSAFPLDDGISSQCGGGTNPTGLTKREYFAGIAMKGILSCSESGSLKDTAEFIGIDVGQYNYKVHYPVFVAMKSLQFADIKKRISDNERQRTILSRSKREVSDHSFHIRKGNYEKAIKGYNIDLNNIEDFLNQ